jgi:hypothetical protein
MYKYIIAGDKDEITPFMDVVLKERRFLSDNKNVADFAWYPLSTFMQAVDLYLDLPARQEELMFFSSEYKSLTIAQVDKDDKVMVTIADGEVLNDTN